MKRTTAHRTAILGLIAASVLPLWVRGAPMGAELNLSASAPAPLKIACVGDSITQGSGLSDEVNLSYPGKLSKLLGTNFVVRNFGVSGTTLLKKGDLPYWKQSAFAASTNFQPDVVIIKLGSNDSKSQNWRYGTNYLADYLSLIAVYTTLPSHPRMFLCTPCPVYKNGDFGINPGIVRTNIAATVRSICQEQNHTLINLHVAMDGHPEWFPDTVHPTSPGTSVMAATICAHLLGIAAGSAESPALNVIASSSTRLHLSWPSSAMTFVLQSAPFLLNPTTTAWTVMDRPLVNLGASIVASNLYPGAARFYRLHRF